MLHNHKKEILNCPALFWFKANSSVTHVERNEPLIRRQLKKLQKIFRSSERAYSVKAEHAGKQTRICCQPDKQVHRLRLLIFALVILPKTNILIGSKISASATK